MRNLWGIPSCNRIEYKGLWENKTSTEKWLICQSTCDLNVEIKENLGVYHLSHKPDKPIIINKRYNELIKKSKNWSNDGHPKITMNQFLNLSLIQQLEEMELQCFPKII